VRARETSQRARHDGGEYPTASGSFSPGKQCAPNESFTSSSSSTIHTGILFKLWWSPALTLAIAHYFLLARRYASEVQDGPVCLSVCQSQVRVLSKRLDESSWVLARELPSTVLKGNSGIFKNKGRLLPSGTLSQTPDLENFASAHRSSKRVINLARQGGSSERDKLDRRRSTQLTIPPSAVVYR